jgi:hypothetical protein
VELPGGVQEKYILKKSAGNGIMKIRWMQTPTLDGGRIFFAIEKFFVEKAFIQINHD